jgi:hypothetical protein
VQDDELGPDPHGGVEGLDRVLEGAVAFPPVVRRKLEDVRRRPIHAHRQRTEIVHAGDLDFTAVHRLENPRQQTDPDAVAQFRVGKSQVPNFPQHRPPVRVSV